MRTRVFSKTRQPQDGIACSRTVVHTTRRTLFACGHHRPLKLSELLSAAAASSMTVCAGSPLTSSAQSAPRGLKGGGLQLNLPPLFTWGEEAVSLGNQVDAYLRITREAAYADQEARHRQQVVRQLHASPLQSVHTPQSSREAASPPLFLALRLFPDSSVAQLLRPSSAAAGHASANGVSSSPRHRLPPAHHISLDVFAECDRPWGSGIDHEEVFRHALNAMEALAARFQPQLPLLVILPTRLMVSQEFCDQLCTLWTRAALVNVAIELPSTPVLFEPDLRHAAHYGGTGEEERDRGERSSSLGRPNRSRCPPWLQQWARLSTLCAPWEVLRRGEVEGFGALRHLSPRQLLPLHVLLPWMWEQRMLHHIEQTLVVDTVAPPPNTAEHRRATLENRRCFGHVNGDAEENTKLEGGADEGGGEGRSRRASVYLNENPMNLSRHTPASRRAANDAVLDAVRRKSRGADSGRSTNSTEEGHPEKARTPANTTVRDATLRVAEQAWRQQAAALGRFSSSSSPSAQGVASDSNECTNGDLLLLDTPPDAVRDLILRSIVPDGAGTPRPQTDLRGGEGTLQGAEKAEGGGGGGGHSASSREDGGSTVFSATASAVPRRRSLQPGAFTLSEFDDDAESRGAPSSARTSTPTASLEQLLGMDGGGESGSDAAALHSRMAAELAKLRRSQSGQSPSPSGSPTVVRGGGPLGDMTDPAFSPTTLTTYGVGYWDCIQCLVERTQCRTVLSMPTFHGVQCQAWYGEFRSSYAAATSASASGSLDTARVPQFVPVSLPLLSPTGTENERLLREGAHFPSPKETENAQRTTEAGSRSLHRAHHQLHRWLPLKLSASLVKALHGLPEGYKLEEKRRAFRMYRRTAEGNAALLASSTTGGGSVIRGGASSDSGECEKSSGPHANPSSADTALTIVSRGVLRRPFWYADPFQIAQQHQRRIAALEKVRGHYLTPSSPTASSTADGERAGDGEGKPNEEDRLVGLVRDGSSTMDSEAASYAHQVNILAEEEAFRDAVVLPALQTMSSTAAGRSEAEDEEEEGKEAAVRRAGSGELATEGACRVHEAPSSRPSGEAVAVVVLAVPPPGVSEGVLKRSWTALFSSQ